MRSTVLTITFLMLTSPLLAVPGAKSPVGLRVTPTNWNGSCPHEFVFIGTITSRGAGDVTYTWDRSDGAVDDSHVVHFTRANQRQSVRTTWSLSEGRGATFHGWEQIKVTAPNFIRSNKAAFRLRCR